ncbi:MAG: hypothetical protein N3E45_05100 [Oscillatoriaceae bacterium SKW80]|nr:hypothetical protein [Oscillatoriaceae bacterium SKYG93]MCX8120191.1 hypothetical protein [Oscillatoriaceae bacterium SKW80]MDW8453117.1 hypothetical protein [Oscillatoriaceae cyanobacterium SKYGB_i_bin93]HIK28972.1 hypothetical protein [Oscillatoriaceae cyanobacterium M7585_C2015_266]
MRCSNDFDTEQFQQALETLTADIRALASGCQGNTLAILALLRSLEAIHQEIRDTLFLNSLPDNRQDLYALLRDIETAGGWPHIPRMRLRSLLVNLASEIANADKSDESISSPASSQLPPAEP